MGTHRLSRGLSLIELMVGTAVGLVAAAAGAALVSAHVHDSRRLVAEARLMQDLRTAADIVARDLRRAGYWASAASGVRGDDEGEIVVANPYVALAASAAASDAVAFAFSRDVIENDTVDGNEQFGFRLRTGALELQLGAGNWQAITDIGTVVVTGFAVESRVDAISLAAFCSAPCPAGSTTCPPRQEVRSVAFTLSGRSAGDANVIRTLGGRARVRNDRIVGSCEV
ncbi:MAG: prepilin-type N-terminal cleavage/methylation domain-containing protein [Caldimonas sp.]